MFWIVSILFIIFLVLCFIPPFRIFFIGGATVLAVFTFVLFMLVVIHPTWVEQWKEGISEVKEEISLMEKHKHKMDPVSYEFHMLKKKRQIKYLKRELNEHITVYNTVLVLPWNW